MSRTLACPTPLYTDAYMQKILLQPLIGLVNILSLILITIIISICIYCLALVSICLPTRIRFNVMQFTQKMPVFWMDGILFMFRLTGIATWQCDGPPLHSKLPQLLICNHRSWVDILIISALTHRKTPPLRFFLKKQLLYTLPFAGLATLILKYPFMSRYTKSQIRKKPYLKDHDLKTTQTACKNFQRYPATIVNFVEGTRFSRKKSQQKKSPYQHLLPPKSAGIATVLGLMQNQIGGIIDVTLVYDNAPVSFWRFCCGQQKKILCLYQYLPITTDLIGDYRQDRNFRRRFQAWLNERWQLKDQIIEEHQQQ